MYRFIKTAWILLSVLVFKVNARQSKETFFKVIPLGVTGGLDESNLSSYMLAATSSDSYVCLDAGTLRAGIQKAIAKKTLKNTAAAVLRNGIKGYLISHAHLDHIAGMIMNSPDDTTKNIYALPPVIDILRDKYFTWQAWANFADEGEKPTLNKYHYVRLNEGTDTAITNTGLRVKAFALSHSAPYQSTAFLIQNKDAFMLYLGDTGPDEVEKSNNLHNLWQTIAPLIKSHSLKAIFIEVSFPNSQPDKQLFGHLTPNWLMKEMETLGILTGSQALTHFPVVVTHMKPTGHNITIIKNELQKQNKLKLKLVYPQQGVLLKF